MNENGRPTNLATPRRSGSGVLHLRPLAPRGSGTASEVFPVALDLSAFKLTFNDDFNSFSSNYGNVPGMGTWSTAYNGDVHSLSGNGEHEFYINPTYQGTSGT